MLSCVCSDYQTRVLNHDIAPEERRSVACSLPHAVVHHDVVLLGHVHDISEATAIESANCKRADASFSLSPYWV